MVDKEDVGLLGHGFGGENELPLPAAIARLNSEEIAAVEGLACELVEEAPVEGGGDAGGGKKETVEFHELVEVGN